MRHLAGARRSAPARPARVFLKPLLARACHTLPPIPTRPALRAAEENPGATPPLGAQLPVDLTQALPGATNFECLAHQIPNSDPVTIVERALDADAPRDEHPARALQATLRVCVLAKNSASARKERSLARSNRKMQQNALGRRSKTAPR